MEKVSLENLNEIFKDILIIENIEISTSRKNTPAWDSMAHIELIGTIEEKFDIEFELDEIIELNSIETIIESINRKLLGTN